MPNKQARTNINSLDAEIGLVLDALNGLSTTEDDYVPTLEHLEKLYKIKAESAKNTVGLRDWIPVIGSVGAVLVIVAFEAAGHSVTSKAVGFVGKLRS